MNGDGDGGGEKASAVIPHGGTPGYQCFRSLGRRGIHTILGANGEPPSEAASRYCDETVSLPSTREDLLAYKDELVRLADRPDVRTILPIWEVTAFVLSKFADEFDGRVDLAVPSFDRLRNVHDRTRLIEVAERAGVPVPETQLLTEVDDWDRDLIVKSRYNLLVDDYVDSFPANRVATAKNVEHLPPGEEPDVDAIRGEMGHVPIVQEFVPWEDEYMVGAICDRGEPLATVQLHQIRENSYTGGGGVYRKSIVEPELDRAVRDLLAELDWHGLACVEYMKRAETGEFVLTEINPRVWQSIAPTVRAGADFPYYYWLLAMGQQDRIDPDVSVGVGSHLLKGEAEHLLSVFRDDSPHVERPNPYATMGEIALSCLVDPHFDVLRFDDPGPFTTGVLSGVRARHAALRTGARATLRELMP